MKITIEKQDLDEAPDAVREWVIRRLGMSPVAYGMVEAGSTAVVEAEAEAATPEAKPAAKPKKSKTKSDKPKPKGKPEPGDAGETSAPVPPLADIFAKAVELMKSQGEEGLQAVLSNVGVARVRECPEDKRRELLEELLAAIAVA